AHTQRRREGEAGALLDAAMALRSQLTTELAEAEKAIDPAAQIPEAPAEPDSAPAHEAQRGAEHARRAAAVAASSVAGLRTRREFLEEQAAQAAMAAAAAATLAEAETAAAQAQDRAKKAEQATVALARLSAELEGIDSLRPPSGHGLRLGDVITARPGSEAALSAVLGSLVDAIVTSDEASAAGSIMGADHQVTALYPV